MANSLSPNTLKYTIQVDKDFENEKNQAKVINLLKAMTTSPSKNVRINACFKIAKMAYKKPKVILKTCSLSKGPIFWLGSAFLVNKNDEDYRKIESTSPGKAKNFTEYSHIKAERMNQRAKRRVIMQLNKRRKQEGEMNWFDFESPVQYKRVLFYYSEIDKDNLELGDVHLFKEDDLKACKKKEIKIPKYIPDPHDYLIWIPINHRIAQARKRSQRSESINQTKASHGLKKWNRKKSRINEKNNAVVDGNSRRDDKFHQRIKQFFPKNVKIHNRSLRVKSSQAEDHSDFRSFSKHHRSKRSRRRQENSSTNQKRNLDFLRLPLQNPTNYQAGKRRE